MIIVERYEALWKMSTDLCKGHSVGMFPDLRQTETLLHLSIPLEEIRAVESVMR